MELLNADPLGSGHYPSLTWVHTLTLAGRLSGGSLFLVCTRVTFSPDAGVTVDMSA